MKYGYFRTEARRLLKGCGLYAAIPGVTASMFFSLEKFGLINGNVLYTFFHAANMSGMRMVFIFCALPYAASFCDDLEYGYVRFQAVRGSLKHYVAAKAGVIYLSSIATLLPGSLIFVLLCRTLGPWTLPDTASGGIIAFEGLIESGHYIWYCMLCSLQLGLLAGIFSVMSALFSLYITNKAMVFVLPVLIHQILGETRLHSAVYLFYGYGQSGNDWHNLLYMVFISAGSAAAMTFGIYRKVRTRM